MSDRGPSYVYILTNPSFREDWVKIGKSSRPVDVRSKELDNTAVPLPRIMEKFWMRLGKNKIMIVNH